MNFTFIDGCCLFPCIFALFSHLRTILRANEFLFTVPPVDLGISHQGQRHVGKVTGHERERERNTCTYPKTSQNATTHVCCIVFQLLLLPCGWNCVNFHRSPCRKMSGSGKFHLTKVFIINSLTRFFASQRGPLFLATTDVKGIFSQSIAVPPTVMNRDWDRNFKSAK